MNEHTQKYRTYINSDSYIPANPCCLLFNCFNLVRLRKDAVKIIIMIIRKPTVTQIVIITQDDVPVKKKEGKKMKKI